MELKEGSDQGRDKFIELETRTITEPGNVDNWIEFILAVMESKGLEKGLVAI